MVEVVKLKKEALWVWLAQGSPETAEREVLTLTGDIVRCWKEYFEELLSPSKHILCGGGRVRRFREAHPYLLKRSGKAPGVEEI